MKNNNRLSILITALCIPALTGSSAFAQDNGQSAPYVEGARVPKGYARPPFHVKPHASTAAVVGLTPATVRHAYGFDTITNQGDGMVIAIVDAYDDPKIE